MATIRAFTERIEKFDAAKSIMEVFLDKKAHVIDKNLDQLQEGLDANGNRFKKYAWEDYAVEKNKMNPKAGMGNPDLKYTGDFWSSFILEQTGETQYEISATDSKANWLENHYKDNDIYGLTGESVADLIERILLKAIREKIQTELSLK